MSSEDSDKSVVFGHRADEEEDDTDDGNGSGSDDDSGEEEEEEEESKEAARARIKEASRIFVVTHRSYVSQRI